MAELEEEAVAPGLEVVDREDELVRVDRVDVLVGQIARAQHDEAAAETIDPRVERRARREERDLMEKLQDSPNFRPQPGKHEKSFFERMKEYFE